MSVILYVLFDEGLCFAFFGRARALQNASIPVRKMNFWGGLGKDIHFFIYGIWGTRLCFLFQIGFLLPFPSTPFSFPPPPVLWDWVSAHKCLPLQFLSLRKE